MLKGRYVLYGEWLYAKHTIFYNHLPHYFLEFDVLDTATETFLDSSRRQELLQRAPFIVSVPVLYRGPAPSLRTLEQLIGRSPAITPSHLHDLRARCAVARVDVATVLRETDLSGLMEGLYLKVEERGMVTARYKYIRPSFRQAVADAQSHWMDRPLLPNGLRPGVRLF